MPEPGDISVFFAARPTLELDGTPDAGLTDGILSVMAQETTVGLSRCEITLGNWGSNGSPAGFLYEDRQIIDFGKQIVIRAGAGEAAGMVFQGRVTGLEGRFPRSSPPEILLLAEDRLQDLRMTRRTRTFEDVTDHDVFQQIASDHGLRPELDIDGPTHRVLAQLNQSDLALLRDRARTIDAEIWISDRTLHASTNARRTNGEVRLTYGQEVIECSVLADLARQRSSLSVSGWDVSAKEAAVHRADAGAIQSELNGHTGGSRILDETFGERAEQMVHLAPANLTEARSQAESVYRQMARKFVSVNALAGGDARIRVGARVTLRGLGRMFSGEYYVTETRHTFDLVHGYRTRFRCERPGLAG